MSLEKRIQMTIGSIILIITGLVMGDVSLVITPAGIGCLAFLGFASAVALILWFFLLRYNRLSSIAIYNFMIPIFGTLCSLILLNERLDGLRSVAALIFVCAGILIVNFKKKEEK